MPAILEVSSPRKSASWLKDIVVASSPWSLWQEPTFHQTSAAEPHADVARHGVCPVLAPDLCSQVLKSECLVYACSPELCYDSGNHLQDS